MIHRLLLIASVLCSYRCNTVTGTAEGLSRGIIFDNNKLIIFLEDTASIGIINFET